MRLFVLIFLFLAIIGIGILLYNFKSNTKENFNEIPNSQNQATKPTDSNQTTSDFPKVTVIATGLDTPWALAFLPDTSILFTERKGNVKRVDPNGNLDNNFKVSISGVKEFGEGGLLGIAIHPNFSTNHYVYLYYTYAANGNVVQNRLVKYKYENDTLQNEEILLTGIPGNSNHDGGRIKFGPDGFLYIGTGDAEAPSKAQDKNSLAGKILRVTEDGKPAPSNPFGSEVYSYGHRNVQGLTWDNDGNLWATEHGRSFPISGLDELNLIKSGQNYGWPTIQGNEQKDGMVTPVANSGCITWAPSGIAFLNGTIYFAGLRGQTLYKANISDIVNPKIDKYLENEYGRLRDVVVGPDKMLYITTSNRDSRGKPSVDDDRILRINPSKL